MTDFPVADPRVRRALRDDEDKLTAVGGLAALSLDALSSVAYGPEAIVVVLVTAGVGALAFTVPIAIAIAILLVVLVLSYRQVIAVHPDGGGAYAVAKQDLNRPASLLAAASLVVDYVLTVAVSLAAGAASLGSVFPVVAHHLLLTCLIGLVLLTAINLVGVAESAKALMLPTIVFIVSILGVVFFGLGHAEPVATIGKDLGPIVPTTSLGVVVVLKAFAAGCSSLTGVEAIANGVPAFRSPAVQRAQRTEVSLGVILGVMLVGLCVLIRAHHIVPRGDVTILAQLSAGAFGTGWAFYVTNLTVTLVLAFAANTSFGGLPVLMSLLAKDNRLPHVFGLRAEKPVYRYGVTALALLAAVILIATGAVTDRLLPLFAIGVFIGFTISQVGLVHYWWTTRRPGWLWRGALNGFGALLSAIAAVVFFSSKFIEGAWLLLVIIPALYLLFERIEAYYRSVGQQLAIDPTVPLDLTPGPLAHLVVVPVGAINRLTVGVLQAAARLGGRILPVTVDLDHGATAELQELWARWSPNLELVVLPSLRRSFVVPIVKYVDEQLATGLQVTVLLTETKTRRRRHQLLHNQRGLVITAALIDRTDAIVANYPYRLK